MGFQLNFRIELYFATVSLHIVEAKEDVALLFGVLSRNAEFWFASVSDAVCAIRSLTRLYRSEVALVHVVALHLVLETDCVHLIWVVKAQHWLIDILLNHHFWLPIVPDEHSILFKHTDQQNETRVLNHLNELYTSFKLPWDLLNKARLTRIDWKAEIRADCEWILLLVERNMIYLLNLIALH